MLLSTPFSPERGKSLTESFFYARSGALDRRDLDSTVSSRRKYLYSRQCSSTFGDSNLRVFSFLSISQRSVWHRGGGRAQQSSDGRRYISWGTRKLGLNWLKRLSNWDTHKFPVFCGEPKEYFFAIVQIWRFNVAFHALEGRETSPVARS